MSAVCKRLRPSTSTWVSFKEEEEQRQRIGSILGLSSSTKDTRDALGSTFSADMPSKKWVSQHFQSKKVTSSEEFSAMSAPESSSSLSAASAEEETKKVFERQGQAIHSQKTLDSNSSAPTPYIHPLVKRSASSLTKKSLEICTESLGSETGSDGFSSCDDLDYSPSEKSEDEEEEEMELLVEDETTTKKELGAVNYSCSISRKSPARSFPPPLPSLSRQDGPCIHMRPHRQDGHLVVEAIPAPSHNYLHAQRQGGRLLLTFINTPPTQEKSEIEEKDSDDDNEEEEKLLQQESQLSEFKREEEDGGETEFEFNAEVGEEAENAENVVIEVKVSEEDIVARGVMKVHRLALVLSGKPLIKNPNPWEGKSAAKREESKKVTGVLPFNAYECCWRRTSSSASRESDHTPHHPRLDNKRFFSSSNNPMLLVRRCQQPGSSLLIWDPRCIATS